MINNLLKASLNVRVYLIFQLNNEIKRFTFFTFLKHENFINHIFVDIAPKNTPPITAVGTILDGFIK